MVKAGQRGGTEAGQAEGTSPASEIVTGLAHVVRGADERAILVSERSAVWDRWVKPKTDEEQAADLGPLGPMPTEWSADLVHCRLLHVDTLARRLPRVKVPAQYRSFLGDLQPQEAAPGRMKPLTGEEERRLDWTLACIYGFGSIDKAVIMGIMSGRKPATISKVTFGIAAREGGKGLRRPTVYKRYRQLTDVIANAWNVRQLPIDEGTRACWLNEGVRK